MKLILLSLLPIVASALSSCSKSTANPSPERAPENGAQFKKGEGLSLTDEMAKSIGLQVAEVSEEKIAPMFTVSLQATQSGNEVSGWLTAEQAARIQPGMAVELRGDKSDAQPMKGSVQRIEKAPYATLGDFDLSVQTSAPLDAGTSVRATFRLPAGEATAAVPRSALLTTAEGQFVYAKNGKFFVRTPVKVGAMSEGHVEITDGLYSGDEVVTAPVMSLWLAELQVLRGGKACTCGN